MIVFEEGSKSRRGMTSTTSERLNHRRVIRKQDKTHVVVCRARLRVLGGMRLKAAAWRLSDALWAFTLSNIKNPRVDVDSTLDKGIVV